MNEIIMDCEEPAVENEEKYFATSLESLVEYVFFCHATSTHTTLAYDVPLVGVDGMKIKATAICHKDTSKWDLHHVSFQVLEVKPGTLAFQNESFSVSGCQYILHITKEDFPF
ncbi:hypothetical protein C5167_030525 [Papaver somniferum]|nr:hypothetical protein C5167_030525 [Papaver somniferum]